MQSRKKNVFLLVLSLFTHSILGIGLDHTRNVDLIAADIPEVKWPEKVPITFGSAGVDGIFNVKYKPESFFARNVHLLNNNIESDKIYFSRHTVDANLGLRYGREYFDYDVSSFFITLRQKVIWGNPDTSAHTADQEIRILDARLGDHRHNIRFQFPRIREVWFSLGLNKMLKLPDEHKHFFTLGSFPFTLGRGIALGDAFAVNPGVLGFYSENTVDQYAYGFKFSGKLADTLSYDLYGAILENLADSFRNTSAKVKGNLYGRRFNQLRGFGVVDYIVAGRLGWRPYNEPCKKVYLEPYWLYNSAPEQKVEIVGDASAQFGSLGFAGEFVHGNFEWGFDYAHNLGFQKVYGIDRNIIQLENRNGVATFVNSRVRDDSPTGSKTIHDPSSTKGREIQHLIEDSAESASQNGKEIGAVGGTDIYNGINRFRDPYVNAFKGWMLVADGSYSFHNGDVKLSAGFGIASGDEDPNKDLTRPNESDQDGVYDGFVGLQEIYSGKRIKSAFLLGSAGRIPRPLTTPTEPTVLDTLPSTVSSFTNLIYLGTSLIWQPQRWDKFLLIMPNFLWYWEQKATKKFDRELNMSLATQDARKYLGFEANVFADLELMPDVKLFFVASGFIPGAHYTDIKGKPLTRDQQRILDRADKTGVDRDLLPLLGNDIGYSFNLGLQVRY